MEAPSGGGGPPAAAAAASADDVPNACDPTGQQRYNDEFMMYVFKVEMCKRIDKHEREKCPYAHPGELARRRHPSLYKALPCPEARARKICPRLENCNCSHSTFEFWLHPDRYKTFMCERGAGCMRPVCFFAHSKDELRELPEGLRRTTPTPPKPAAGVPEPLSSSSAAAAHAHSSSHSWHERARPGGSGAHVVWQPGGRGGGSQQAAGWPAQQPGYAAPLQGSEGLPGWGASSSSGGGGMSLPHQQQQAGQLAHQAYVGYQQLPGAAAHHPPPGAIMLHSGLQRGTTVAVIPAGPSAWSGGGLGDAADDAPTLEALCAAINRSVVLHTPQPQQGAHGLLLEPFQPAAAAAAAGAVPHQTAQQQQQLPVLSVGGGGAPQVQPPPSAQTAHPQLLPGQPVVVMMPPADDSSAVAWSAMPQPGI